MISFNILRLSGHLYCQEVSRWTKKTLNLNVEGLAVYGKPKLRWSDGVNTDLRKKGIQVTTVSDRSKFRDAIRPRRKDN